LGLAALLRAAALGPPQAMSRESKSTVPPKKRLLPYFVGLELELGK
jgi:hypothetical protein